MTVQETAAVLAKLSAAYPKPVDQAVADLWLESFEDATGADVLAAVRDHIRESDWFPTVAEIRTRIFGPPLAKLAPMSSADAQARATRRRMIRSTVEALGLERTREMHGSVVDELLGADVDLLDAPPDVRGFLDGALDRIGKNDA